MTIATNGSIVEALRCHRLLEPAQLNEVERVLHGQCPDPRNLARELLDRGWLTTFQANQLLAGKADQLVLGTYLILDRIGQGASGEVFKARHQTMKRIVALKVLRKDVQTDVDIVGRFYREIEVASQLSHPNIVHALDAGPIGNQLVLALEYVDGIDLNRLVKDGGRLAIDQACDYIRQAACGLGHAHEKGLIHRDIKPSNLLVARAMSPSSSGEIDLNAQTRGYGLVKLLDLGLARLAEPPKTSATRNLTVLAGGQMLMGTPDYMAPEQALDFHGADIRSDIYSLGCTFYFLLAGEPPFAGVPLHQKLLKHQQTEPPPIEQRREDLPSGIPAILKMMLAKRPADRYQTPAEVSAALTSLLATLPVPPVPAPPADTTPTATSQRRGSTVKVDKEAIRKSGPVDIRKSGQVAIQRPKTTSRPAVVVTRKTGLGVRNRPPVKRVQWVFLGAGAVVVLGGLALLGSQLLSGGSTSSTQQARASQQDQPTLPGGPVPTEPMRFQLPALVIQCGKGKDGDKQKELAKSGYDCRLTQGFNFDGWGGALKSHCWADPKEVRFEVTVPPGTAGGLRMLLLDGDTKTRKQSLMVQGKPIGSYEKFNNAGELITVPLSAEETRTGKIEVVLRNLGPINAVISTVEFLPARPRR